jgi:hypothetical protein
MVASMNGQFGAVMARLTAMVGLVGWFIPGYRVSDSDWSRGPCRLSSKLPKPPHKLAKHLTNYPLVCVAVRSTRVVTPLLHSRVSLDWVYMDHIGCHQFRTVVQNGCTERLYRTVVQNGCTERLYRTVVQNGGTERLYRTVVQNG